MSGNDAPTSVLFRVRKETEDVVAGIGTWMNDVALFRLRGYRGHTTTPGGRQTGSGRKENLRTGMYVVVGGALLAAYLVYFR